MDGSDYDIDSHSDRENNINAADVHLWVADIALCQIGSGTNSSEIIFLKANSTDNLDAIKEFDSVSACLADRHSNAVSNSSLTYR